MHTRLSVKIDRKTLSQSILSLAGPFKVPSFISGSSQRHSKCFYKSNLLSYYVVSTIFSASVPCRDVSCRGRWCWQMLFEDSGDTGVMQTLSPTGDESASISIVGSAGAPLYSYSLVKVLLQWPPMDFTGCYICFIDSDELSCSSVLVPHANRAVMGLLHRSLI